MWFPRGPDARELSTVMSGERARTEEANVEMLRRLAEEDRSRTELWDARVAMEAMTMRAESVLVSIRPRP
jgi:hypothetical protein